MSRARRNWIDAFYCIGVAATLTCLTLILAGNTELFWPFEHRSLPLSWEFAGAALFAFLAAEFCHFPSLHVSLHGGAEDRSVERSPEFETVEP
jgi:hypothetical protein